MTDVGTETNADSEAVGGDLPDESELGGGIVIPGQEDGYDAQEDLKTAIAFDQPVEEVPLVNGRVLKVYAKSEGQNGRTEAAHQVWIEAMQTYHDRIGRKRSWWARRKNTDGALEVFEGLQMEVRSAKYEYFRRIFEDRFREDLHQDLSPEEFLALTPDQQETILSAYRRVNDVTRLLRIIIPNWDKKKALAEAISQRGIRT